MNADQLTKMIDDLGIRQDELAKDVGISPSYVTKMKSGDRRITDDLADALRDGAVTVHRRQRERRTLAAKAVASAIRKPSMAKVREAHRRFRR